MGRVTRSSITAEQAKEMRELRAAGWSQAALGKKYEVHAATVSRIVRGEAWVDAGGPLQTKQEKTPEDDWYEVDETTGCWLWKGRLNPGGYGVYATGYDAGFSQLAHRYFYETRVGPIPEGYEVDHLCRTEPCVNPAHLAAVSPATNSQRRQSTKLTWRKVREIRRFYAGGGWSQHALAEKFEVSRASVCFAVMNKSWHDPDYTPPKWGRGSKKHLGVGGVS